MPLGRLHTARQRHGGRTCVSWCVPAFAAGGPTHKRVSLLLADVRDASCIIYVLCALSAVHKSQMLLLSAGPAAVNMLEQGDAKPNNNKQVFSVTNSSHFGTNNKGGAGGGGGTLGSRRPKTSGFVFCIFSLGEGVRFFRRKGRRSFSLVFFPTIRWTRECLSVSPASLLERSLGRVTRDSLRAKQTAVTYGEDVQPCVRAAQHKRPGTQGTISSRKRKHFFFLFFSEKGSFVGRTLAHTCSKFAPEKESNLSQYFHSTTDKHVHVKRGTRTSSHHQRL